MKSKGNHCSGYGADTAKVCTTICKNSGSLCSFCNNYDVMSCRYNVNSSLKISCIPTCERPGGPCPEGETFYEKAGAKFEK